ncbi:DUF6884 domain-containing protein [Streptomyces sp. NPDC004658]|uniref:DUF6884 domain-containing protein n=1 Tax=Streptomyces sp. NPDC004658 TaxID=3154672 RepID=UPI0033BC1384
MTLSPTGARILAENEDGIVRGHPAALARLHSDRLIRYNGGTPIMTPAGHQALADWIAQHGRPAPAAPGIAPKLPARQHEAVLTAARRPDQLVPSRETAGNGEEWFNARTLEGIRRTGFVTAYPGDPRSLYLTAEGRAYARQRGGIDVRRRKFVLVACGQNKQPDPDRWYPAGELYTGGYHLSLRGAADALTSPPLIRIVSALHGLVPLTRKLRRYDVRPGDPEAITADGLSVQTAALGLDDADVIFLGGQDYIDLLVPSVPHLFTPLTGGMGQHKGQCRQAREDASLRERWWTQAAALFDRHHTPDAQQVSP